MTSLTVGVDVGGTKVLAGVVDAHGKVLRRLRTQTPHRSLEPTLVETTVVEAVERLRSSYDVIAVGIGAAGFVDLDGVVRFSPHLAWRDEPLSRLLEDKLGLPVAVDNDANTTALAESRIGAGRGARAAICLTLGTGIGGAILADGRLLRGANGLAGEFGHMQLVPDGRECECGQVGCWEQYCSGRALLRAARTQLGAPAEPTGESVTTAAERGEPWAVAAFDEVGTWLGIGVAGLTAGLDPEVVIIGGGLSGAGALLLEPARAVLAQRLTGRGFRPVPALVAAELGPDAGMIGAGLLAQQRHALG